MFQNLTDKFENIFGKLSKKGVLKEGDVDEVLREIRLALLDADVNLEVVKGLQSRIKQRSVGEDVHKALNPAQQVVKIVNEELTNSLGGETYELGYAQTPPTVVLMAGLQGSGKTTTSAKLARWFKSQGRNPLLVGSDLARPAAVEQLRTLAAQIDVPVYSEPSDPIAVAAGSIEYAAENGRDVVIVDTAGRLSIDEELMEEIAQISSSINPHHTFLVVDAMTGQDAVNTAKAFHDTLALDGVILTKLDGDSRGGAALSVKEVVGRPIAFAATGETLADFDLFHPDRMANRILGMGDVLSLIEKAEETFEKEEAEQAATKMLEGQFTLEDFLAQMQQLKKMGPLGNLVGMMPGLPKEARDVKIEDSHVARIEAIIKSMTPVERIDPSLIDGSRRNRIAAGSGVETNEVSQLVSQFLQMKKMLNNFGGLGTKKIKKNRKKNRRKAVKGSRVTAKGGKPQTQAVPSLDQISESDLSDLADRFGLPKS